MTSAVQWSPLAYSNSPVAASMLDAMLNAGANGSGLFFGECIVTGATFVAPNQLSQYGPNAVVGGAPPAILAAFSVNAAPTVDGPYTLTVEFNPPAPISNTVPQQSIAFTLADYNGVVIGQPNYFKPGVVYLGWCISPSTAGPNQLNLLSAGVGSVVLQGSWDASTGNPPSTSPAEGQAWVVSVAGATDLSGITSWSIGDWAVWTGSVWTKLSRQAPASTQPSLTGSATFAAATNTITMTGIVAALGLDVGDVIQIAGTAKNNFTMSVESITDANNVICNAAHANGAGPLSLTSESDASATIQRVAKWYSAPAGLGQMWVTTNRSVGVTYAGLQNRTMQVSGAGSGAAASGLGAIVSGVAIFGFGSLGSESQACMTFDVPPASTYTWTGSLGRSEELR